MSIQVDTSPKKVLKESLILKESMIEDKQPFPSNQMAQQIIEPQRMQPEPAKQLHEQESQKDVKEIADQVEQPPILRKQSFQINKATYPRKKSKTLNKKWLIGVTILVALVLGAIIYVSISSQSSGSGSSSSGGNKPSSSNGPNMNNRERHGGNGSGSGSGSGNGGAITPGDVISGMR